MSKELRDILHVIEKSAPILAGVLAGNKAQQITQVAVDILATVFDSHHTDISQLCTAITKDSDACAKLEKAEKLFASSLQENKS